MAGKDDRSAEGAADAAGEERRERGKPSRRDRAERERARRRAQLLQELDEARALRRRVAPRKSRIAEERRAWWIRSFIGR